LQAKAILVVHTRLRLDLLMEPLAVVGLELLVFQLLVQILVMVALALRLLPLGLLPHTQGAEGVEDLLEYLEAAVPAAVVQVETPLAGLAEPQTLEAVAVA
jgi:hypothetical protein